MPTNGEVHREIFEKVNANTISVTALVAEMKIRNDYEDKLIMLLEKAQNKLFRSVIVLGIIVLFCVGIIGYGAIGKDGMYTVRNTSPSIIANGQSTASTDDLHDGENGRDAK